MSDLPPPPPGSTLFPPPPPGSLSVGDLAAQAAALTPGDIEIARTKNDSLGAYLREQAKVRQPNETDEAYNKRLYGGFRTPDVGILEGAARSYVQGGGFGSGDEGVAAGAASLNKAMDKDPGRGLQELYDAYLSRERERLKQFRTDHPVISTVAEIAGAIPTAVVSSIGGAPPGASLLGRMGASAAEGALQGTAYGFASGEGGLEGRLPTAAVGGTAGGILGGITPIVGEIARNAARFFRTSNAADEAGMSRAAYNVLNRTMSADDSFTGPGAQRLAAAGPDAMLADAGPNARSLLDTAVQRSGPAATVARDAIEGRVGNASQQITNALDTTLGAPQGVRATENALRNNSAAAREAAYRQAYAAPIDYASAPGQEILGIIQRRVPSDALTKANALMRAEGHQSRQILFQVGDDGTVTLTRLPDVRQIDYITRGLNEVADAADGAGRLGGTTQLGRAYSSLSRELRNLTRGIVPEYGHALETAAEPIAQRNALRLGEGALSSRVARDELAEAVQGMTAAERGYVAQGIRSQIDESIANVRRAMTDGNMDAREATKALRDLSSTAAREKIELVVGPQQAQQLFQALDQAAAAFELRASVATNSRTFARTELDNTVRAQTDQGPVNALRSGEPVSATKRLAQLLMGRTEADKTRIADETYSDLVRALTGPRGQQATQSLQTLQQSNLAVPQQAELQRLLAEMLMRPTAAAGSGQAAYLAKR